MIIDATAAAMQYSITQTLKKKKFIKLLVCQIKFYFNSKTLKPYLLF